MSTGDTDEEREGEGERAADASTPEGGSLLVTERETPEGLLVSVCDRAVLGETFEDGAVSLTVTEEFYGGDAADEEAVVNSLARASVANLVGTDTVALAIEAGFVDEANVLEVGSTLHAQVLRMS